MLAFRLVLRWTLPALTFGMQPPDEALLHWRGRMHLLDSTLLWEETWVLTRHSSFALCCFSVHLFRTCHTTNSSCWTATTVYKDSLACLAFFLYGFFFLYLPKDDQKKYKCYECSVQE
jgi:hypothetical protein